MDGPGEGRRVAELERSQAGKVGRAMQQTVQSPKLGLQSLRQVLVIVGSSALQIHRIEQGLDPGLGHGVIDAIEARRLATQQDHGSPGRRTRGGGSAAQATSGAGDQHHPASQCTGVRLEHGAHCWPASATMRLSSPDSNSSMMMSQPPISSPLMKN